MKAPRATSRAVRRDLVLAAAAVGALLAVVGVASTAPAGAGSETASRLAFPGGVLGWVYAGCVVAGALAFPLFLYLSTRTDRLATRRRRAWLWPLWLAGLAGVLLAIRALLGDRFEDVLDRLRLGGAIPVLPRGSSAAVPPAPEAVPLAALLTIAVGGVAAAYAVRSARRRRHARLAAAADEMAALLETTIDELRAEPDARRAIVRAYCGMEATLARSGVCRDGAEAPLEYVARVLLALEVRAEPVRALTELFERARFSAHALGPEAKAAAIAALEHVRADLAAA